MLEKIKKQIMWLQYDEEGQGLVEYGLLVFLIAVVCVTMVTNVGTHVSTVFSQVTSALTGS